jgi:hypothetical protein
LVDWWHPLTKEKYVEKAQCIIHQYGNFTIPDLVMIQQNLFTIVNLWLLDLGDDKKIKLVQPELIKLIK